MTCGPLSFLELRDPTAFSSASIAPARGAIVTSFAVHGRELLFMDRATLEDPGKNVRGGIPVLFPSPGKLDRDEWRYGSDTGVMQQHGFARNLPWTVASLTPSTATLTLADDATTRERYPWSFRVELRIELRGACLQLTTSVTNADSRPMPYGLGFHPYFHVRDKSRARIPSAATRAFENVRKAIVPFAGFDLAHGEVDLHLLDHDAQEATLHLEDDARIVVRGSSDIARWVVWTLPERDFVCLEPWTAPGNALNTGENLIVLPPGASHTTRVELELFTQ